MIPRQSRDFAEAEIQVGISGQTEKVASKIAEFSWPRDEKLIDLVRRQIGLLARIRVGVHVEHVMRAAIATRWSTHNVAGREVRRVDRRRMPGFGDQAAAEFPSPDQSIQN